MRGLKRRRINIMRTKKVFAAISLVLILTFFLSVQVSMPSALAQEEEEQSDLGYQMEFLGRLIQFVQANYYEEVDIQKLIDGAYKGVFDQLDPYSLYYTEEEYEDFDTKVSGNYGGIGVHISFRDGYVTVISPIEGTPADRAGLKPGDRVVSVDDIDVTGISIDKVASMMRGEPGTTVKIGVLREGQPGILYFEMIRENVELNPVRYEIIEDNTGYIRLSDFNGNADENVDKALEYFDEAGIKDIIIDLRNNPGGIIDQAVSIAAHFVPEGPVVHVDRRDGDRKTYYSELKESKYNLAVLVNEGSASASEIFAGAVQDTGAGVLVGTRTFGKGTVQTVLPLKNGGNIKLTIAKYLTPKERKIDGVGLTPDIVVEDQHPGDKYSGELAPIKGDRKPSLNVVGLDVLGAEQRLDVMGYDVGDIDGIFDRAMLQAVAKFQADTGLYPYGVLDFATQQKLQEKFDEFIEQDDVDEQLQKAIEVLKSKR
jgi:carboxyl-terminal processing protease